MERFHPKVRWERPDCIGDLPSKRSGHTFTEIDSYAYLFGGCISSRLEGDCNIIPPRPTNEVYKLDLESSGSSYYWTKLLPAEMQGSQNSPSARWNHSAARFNDNRIVIFGGFSASKDEPHLNDVWVLDTSNDSWEKPSPNPILELGTSGESLLNGRPCPWRSCAKEAEAPAPRGLHSATLICNDLLVVYGGYGGAGYTRRDFDDVHALCLRTWQWYCIKTIGPRPPPRSGHQSVAVDGSLFVMGGCSVSRQYDDLHILDGETLTWSRPDAACGPNSWGPSRWNFAAVSVFAVPHRKVFVFGGNSGVLDASTSFDNYESSLQVLECFDNTKGLSGNDVATSSSTSQLQWNWVHLEALGEKPTPRASSSMFFSLRLKRLVLFGGWSNTWHDDVYTCEVSEVVGPPYNIFDVVPLAMPIHGAPVTGGSEMVLRGRGFRSGKASENTTATVRLSCLKGFVEVVGDVVDDCSVHFKAPSFQQYGATIAQVRLKLSGTSFTNGVVNLPYFSVTDCTRSVAFGPGLLRGNDVAQPTTFVIQAKDGASADRTYGIDSFCVTIVADDGLPGSKDPISHSIVDNSNGTYTVVYTPPLVGSYQIGIEFAGTFGGVAGPIRGSPFISTATECHDSSNREMAPATATEVMTKKRLTLIGNRALQEHITSFTQSLRSFTLEAVKALEKNVNDDDLNGLLSVKENLCKIADRTEEFEVEIESNRAALLFLKRNAVKFPSLEKSIKNLNAAAFSWEKTKKRVPVVEKAISLTDSVWREKIRFKIVAYESELKGKLLDFRSRPFWSYLDSDGKEMHSGTVRGHLENAVVMLKTEQKSLDENRYLCDIFGLCGMIDSCQKLMQDMQVDLKEVNRLWCVKDGLEEFVRVSKQLSWRNLDTDFLEKGGKSQLKAVKGLHKCIHWSEAFKGLDRKCRNFLATIPLVVLLQCKSMRDRHWKQLVEATDSTRSFAPPCGNTRILLGSLLSLDIYKNSDHVEEICDKANKEEKMELCLQQIRTRWASIVFIMTPYLKDGPENGIPLLGMTDEDYESLENDQMAVQSMLASRFVTYFQKEVNLWQKSLFNVNEVFSLLKDIQRTWSYLEPLFVHSEEVKVELPDDAMRFERIDVRFVKKLRCAWKIGNVRDALNQEGLYADLEEMQEQLEMCKKSLADFLDGRRRQFPRYYFVSEADLLDILSNGSKPETILCHIPKVYLCTKTVALHPTEKTESGRPIATEFSAGVGSEVCIFEPPVPLEGKVEVYMQAVLDAQKVTIFETVKRSLVRYKELPRSDWVLAKDPLTRHSLDPAQTTLLVLGINYVEEVERSFEKIQSGENHNALEEYSKKQHEQLDDLIRMTQSDLTKGDRTRIMVCITMDAHARDLVRNMIHHKVTKADSFLWQSQLKHRYRIPPPHANYQGRNLHLRGGHGERAEISICDAILPYDYEYLGNGPRLVVTPLTDRIYVTATQALNLKMGCAPAGPAGTGKTETTKDLANALAKLIYVINCSPEMDYKGLGNIFKGVASSGAWVCFDEFNRLIPEVLSVCTVQFKAVCDGIIVDSSKICVEGDEISLDPTCGAFITMNPGYLGRSELPEGLKALFRPMTVMVPDLILICENMLMAEGFVTAKVLASKFFCLYSLLKALLSAQLHYDWGLRAIKSVLVVAGSFKRAEPSLPEDALLMRALRDFNIPKIVREDEVVFFGLLGDLFPGIDPPRKCDENFKACVEQACLKLGNDPDKMFCLKVAQLEELLSIRHCVFVMGPPGSGKSQCWRTLVEARNLREPEMPTRVVDLNPKAVKTEELYGYISLATREWRDGLLSNLMRNLSNAQDEKPKWILFDGDLDANWIESMNSVMDDNRMLTLASNERIPLLPHMRMIFEIRDLKHATPATVSRAGILYISTDEGNQWKSLIKSWIAAKEGCRDFTTCKLPSETALPYSSEILATLEGYFDKYVNKALEYLALNTKSVVPIENMNRVELLLNLLDGCLGAVSISTPEALEVVFVYCSVWAMGSSLGTLDDGTDYRKLFSDWWRAQFACVKFPSRDTIFDYWLDPETNSFGSWTKSPFFYSTEHDSRAKSMAEVTVPTPETCSVSNWMHLLVKCKKPVMLAGMAGTGKTQLVKGMLGSFDPNLQTSTTINFNYYTTSSVLATTMSLSLEKKTGSNYGPPGQKNLVYFVDDLNLPEVDAYNTQSAIAHLRQHMEYEHHYELDKMMLRNITNTQVVACMNPTAGSFVVNPRLQRWFATFSISLPGSTSLLTIYQTFLEGHLTPFTEDVRSQSTNILKAAMGLHAMVSSAFKKTAINFHYEFNLRHISNVFQGLLVSTPETLPTPEKLVLLWLHESERVYGDRLVNAGDLAKYNSFVQMQCKKIFSWFPTAKYYSRENAEPLLFCHYAESVERPLYDQVTSLVKMNHILDNVLQEHNEMNANMDLVLFEDAMRHVARIVRIFRIEGGHALLVGVGGSGKQSLACLASFICGFSVIKITINSTYSMSDFKDDLKVMYRKAGVKEEGVVFLLTDSQITDERFLVYVNDLLASGKIPDLFDPDEVDDIIGDVAARVKGAGLIPDRANCWNYFIGHVRRNLHVCLCFSPIGDKLRILALRFPALVNCTVIDIFHPWPREALYSVGKKFLRNLDLGADAERDVIERFLPFSFEAVNKATVTFQIEDKRHVYTTPKSYLEFIKLFSCLLEKKRKEASADIDRLDSGLEKLRETKECVAKLEVDLKEMLDDAAAKKKKAETIAETVARERASVEKESFNAETERNEVAKIQRDVLQQQQETEEDLAKAEPAVEAAMSALDTLDQKDLTSCKGMLKPPPKLNEVFAATMCLLAGVMPSIVLKKNGQVKDTSWDAAKKQLMGNIKEYMTYLKEIKSHVDCNTINHINFREVRQYIQQDYFNVEAIKAKNQAAAGLCSFVLNIVQYYDIVVTVEPKRKALVEANAQLAEANAKLDKIIQHVFELSAKLKNLTHELKEATTSKKEAMDAVSKGEYKLSLAQRLMTSLASENERWGKNISFLRKNAELLTGDILLASAFVSYAGPFSKAFRSYLMEKEFKPFLMENFTKAVGKEGRIPMSENFDPMKVLTTDVEVARWNADKLPADLVSSENAAILNNTSRWPLIIDPQLQGIRWLKQKESAPERNLQIVRQGQHDLIRKLETAVENGYTLIIENIGESLDAILSPVIQRVVTKRGSRYFVKIGDKERDFHPNFRLYLHTKLSNPHYPPEIQAETTLINFTVTLSGLEDQLLNLVVEKERPDLAFANEELVCKLNGFTITMKELEDNILNKLATAQGDITDDVALVEGLEDTKRLSSDIEEQSESAKQTQSNIRQTSEAYRSVANRSSLLFFLMNDLINVHAYYTYSLEAFQQVFYRAIDSVSENESINFARKEDNSENDDYKDDYSVDVVEDENVKRRREMSAEELLRRCEQLKGSITRTVFNFIRRGLFEDDKLTVTTMLTLKILINDGKVDAIEADYLIRSRMEQHPGDMGSLLEWLPGNLWPKLKALERLACFKGLGDKMQRDSDDWSDWFDVEKVEKAQIPSISCTPFQKLILLRVIRPDRLMCSLKEFVKNAMGQEYVTQDPFDMKSTYLETCRKTPVFFVLFPGVDPTPWVQSLGNELGMTLANGRFVSISMGQGQEEPAETILRQYAKDGGFVLLQNCHLMSNWVPKLERLLELITEDAHPDFRCFLSAEPPQIPTMRNMPDGLMQRCIKVANEIPSDIRSNLMRAWKTFDQSIFDASHRPSEMKACLFSLCWMHSVLLGRKRFGSQGWSKNYSFSNGDLQICSNILADYLASI